MVVVRNDYKQGFSSVCSVSYLNGEQHCIGDADQCIRSCNVFFFCAVRTAALML